MIDPGELTVTGLVDFTDSIPEPGLENRNDIIALDGISFGERFAGLTSFRSGSIEGFSGTVTEPLTLLAGAANQNLALANEGAGGFLVGISSLNGGFPNVGALGEGMVAMMFDTPQSQIGFDLVGLDFRAGFSLVADFWRADGSFIGRSVTTRATPSVAYERAGGLADIAGVIIVNSDVDGVGFNNIRFALPTVTPPSQTVVPEPSSWAMLIAGFGLVGAAARRRRRALAG